MKGKTMACENLKKQDAVSFNVEVFDEVILREIGTTIRHHVSRSDKARLTRCVATIMASNVIVRAGFDFDFVKNLAATLLPLLDIDEVFYSSMSKCLFYTDDEHLGASVNENARNYLHKHFADWVVDVFTDGTSSLSFQVVA
jgi:hypothetical protein